MLKKIKFVIQMHFISELRFAVCRKCFGPDCFKQVSYLGYLFLL